MSDTNLKSKFQEFQINDWELKLGDNVSTRTTSLGHESNHYRKCVNLPPVNKDVQDRHNHYIHELGKESLRTQFDEEKIIELEKAALLKKTTKVAKILKRKIKVTDLEDGGISVSIDQEWDTSTWSEELIQAGCDALILIFYDISADGSTTERKQRAIQMLQKLLFRHTYAESYIRKNLELLISKAANKLIRRGKCCALLDLLFIIDSCKDKFMFEISSANFNGKVIEMCMQEANLAAIMIQHTYRAKRNKKLTYRFTTIGTNLEGFGTDREIRMSRIGLINARTVELKDNWRLLHRNRPSHQIGALRGPIHIGINYTKVILELIAYLVSEQAKTFAHSNREDVLRSKGCILFTTFLAYHNGEFASITSKILANIAKVWEGYMEIIGSGCIHSAVKYMKHLRIHLNIAIPTTASSSHVITRENKHDKLSPHDAYLSCLDIISYTAIHAAGIYRAYLRYRYITPPYHEVERVDYSLVGKILLSESNYTQVRFTAQVKYIFGHVHLLKELSTMIITTNKSDLLEKCLKCILYILCTEAHSSVMIEIKAMQGVLLIRLVELLHSTDQMISNIVLSIFLQICTEDDSRKILNQSKINKYLSPFRDQYKGKYKHSALHRNIAVSVALCRQYNWRYYDPQILQWVLEGNNNNNLDTNNENTTDIHARFYGGDIHYLNTHTNNNTSTNNSTSNTTMSIAKEGIIRLFIFYDLLRTMRTTVVITDSIAEQLSIADWVILENNESSCQLMSQNAILFGVKSIVDFLCHPEEINYYDSLPLQESAAVCIVLEGLSTNRHTAQLAYSSGVINFLSKYIYLCKYLFLGKTMCLTQILIVLNGVKSAAIAFGRFSISIQSHLPSAEEYVQVVRSTELLNSIIFFVNTLSVTHPKLEDETLELQKVVGIGCLDFMNMYATLVISIEGKSKISTIRDLFPLGVVVVNVSYI